MKITDYSTFLKLVQNCYSLCINGETQVTAYINEENNSIDIEDNIINKENFEYLKGDDGDREYSLKLTNDDFIIVIMFMIPMDITETLKLF